MTHLNVSEIFGPTIQGEGRNAGQLASFLRLAGCNLTCDWCDTPYTWDWDRHDRAAEVRRMHIDTVAARLNQLPGRIVVSGGEPLLQANALALLWHIVPQLVWDVETNGTRPLGATHHMWNTITCSPKIQPSSGQDAPAAAVLPEYLERADFKFVVADGKDLQAVIRWLGNHPQVPPHRVWLMPEGTTPQVLTERTPWLAQAAAHMRVNLTTRLHVYGWPNHTRGH